MTTVSFSPFDADDAAGFRNVSIASWNEDVGVRPCPFTFDQLPLRGSEKLQDPSLAFVLLRDDSGEPAGAARIKVMNRDAPEVATGWLAIEPNARRQGFGQRLLQEVEEWAAAQGCTTVTLRHWFSAPTLESTPGWSLATSSGYHLGQHSEARIHQLPLAEEIAEACKREQRIDPNYEVVAWEAPCPDEYVDGLAELRGMFNDEAPSGHLPVIHQNYDRERLREDEHNHREQGETSLIAAAIHILSRVVAGYSEVNVPLDEPALSYQGVTLVRPEHRGHGLGLRLKLANIENILSSQYPVGEVLTMNAADNAQMIRVNELLGMRLLDQCPWP